MTEALLWFANHMHIFILVAKGITIGIWLGLLGLTVKWTYESYIGWKRLKIVRKQLEQRAEDRKPNEWGK